VRVIAITNQDLAALVKAGSFRADLYHRLKVFPLALPALREHKQDLPAIAAHLLARAERRRPFGGAGGKLGPDALEVFARYDWPGNVRELENVLERAQILSPGRELDGQLFESLLETPLSTPRNAPGPAEFHLRRNLDALEKEIVQRALSHTGGKKKEAALLLGIDPRNLGYYLRKHKLAEG
jgi:two-component system response regulator AtoC